MLIFKAIRDFSLEDKCEKLIRKLLFYPLNYGASFWENKSTKKMLLWLDRLGSDKIYLCYTKSYFMKKIGFIFLLFILIAFKGSQTWLIEPNYKINFTIGYFAGTCNGSIAGLIGNVMFDENDLKKSVFNFGVDLNTLKTGIEKRDDHLKTSDYFNITKYPTIIFKSTAITKTTTGYIAEGILTIKTVTKKVQLPFTFKDNAGAAVFSSKFKINRQDFFIGESTWKLKDSVSVSVALPVKKI